ncbi:hypothetical protein SRB5_47160 [Streptomyces sp. RB5]|uniref:DUF11 domain-containing protein n=1 Tax=Streptomyces smaragdinus TaxID=2585196 RepID=A0A7K0CM33_9ACTN|nr:hypothetical protein [Streptomyces smaragdinus]MQY14548.1 hypothetical protein [Streptomyces smaragdinus]
MTNEWVYRGVAGAAVALACTLAAPAVTTAAGSVPAQAGGGVAMVKQLVTTSGPDGAELRFEIRLSNDLDVAVSGLHVVEDLDGLLDNTGFLSRPRASTGTVQPEGGYLLWDGDIAPHATATISYVLSSASLTDPYTTSATSSWRGRTSGPCPVTYDPAPLGDTGEATMSCSARLAISAASALEPALAPGAPHAGGGGAAAELAAARAPHNRLASWLGWLMLAVACALGALLPVGLRRAARRHRPHA